MSVRRSHSPKESSPSARHHAPLNSVSTRIVLCVFGSTLLTALIVSWLSIGAIHGDVEQRVEHRTRTLLSEREEQIEASLSVASAQLAASSAIGTRWHDAAIRALSKTDPDDSPVLVWTAEPDPDRHPALDLPSPPKEVTALFDRVSFRRVAGTDRGNGALANALPCLSARVDVVHASSEVAGRLEGCLSKSALVAFLEPPMGDYRGTRLMVVDREGRVAAAGGTRARGRLGERLPMAKLIYPNAQQLAAYVDDAGTKLVGSMAPLAETGWHLVAETEHARAFAPAIAITNQIFIIDVCIILLFSVLAYKITLAIMHPIEALSEGAERISHGQTDYQIPLPANLDDELGLLTRTFNDMVSKLHSNQLEIENDRIRLGEKNDELQSANEILSQLSITDGLTKLHNHRYFQDSLTREIKRVSRTNAPLSLILIDIDDFKQLNDTHGHAAGDDVLISLAAIMNDSARESDLIARYGGEEFVILMPNTDLAGAVHLAEKIRMAVEQTRLIIGDNMKPINITVSLGVALFDGNRREFFAEADRALYQAKAAGKNCVIIAGSEPSEHP